jgi:hypothetical protein
MHRRATKIFDPYFQRYAEAMKHAGNGERIRALLPLLREMTAELEQDSGQGFEFWITYTNVKNELGAAMIRGTNALDAAEGQPNDVTDAEIVQAANATNQATMHIQRRLEQLRPGR